MDQDPVESFIKNKQKFSLSLLLSAHSKLSVQQLLKGCVTQEDTQLSLRAPISGQQLTSAEISAHAGLLFESIITPSLSATGQVKLQVSKDVLGNDEAFIGAILGVVQNKCAGVEYPWVEEFKREAIAFLRQLNAPLKPAEPEPAPYENVSSPVLEFVAPPVSLPKPVPVMKAPSPASILSPPPALTQQVLHQVPPLPPPQQAPQQAASAPVEYDGPEEHKYAPARLEFERAEPIVRLLAQLRKVGMDILFPQSTHDKILAIIFVAVKSFATPAHRELIDMVMTVKESGKVSQLEPVSKTKIRGVLALLKHGELLVTQGDYGEPVRLYLAPGIETFKDLRERHDSFLSMYMLDHHLFIPAMLRTELVWQLDEETRQMRLDAMDKLVFKLKHFFGGLAEYSANAIEREGSDTTASPESTAAKGPQGGAFLQAQGYGGRGGRGAGKYDLGGVPGRGNMGGRGYPPYGGGPPGGRGGRYGQYGPYGGHFNGAGYDGYGGGGYGGGGYGGRYVSYATSRAQHQRMANAQASLNWANNEDYAELANDDWNESGAAKGSSARSAATAAVAVAPLGSGSVTLPMHDSGSLKSSLSPQAPSFDPTKLKGGQPGGPKKGSPSQELAGDMLDFDYSSLRSSGGTGGAQSRLQVLTSGLGSASLGANDSAWLTAATTTGRTAHSATATSTNAGASSDDYHFWNDSGSSFFNSVAEAGLSSAMEGLNLDSRPYQSSGVVGVVTPPLDLGLSLSLGGDSSVLGGGHNSTEA